MLLLSLARSLTSLSLIPHTRQPEPKGTKRTLQTLQAQLAYLGRRANPGSKTNSGDVAGDIAGEYQALMEQEYLDFVLFEVPWIVL